MYVCVCKPTTDRQIRNAVYEGACSMRDVCLNLGIASSCGKCGQCAREIFEEARAEVASIEFRQAA